MKIQFVSDLHLEFTPNNIDVIENAATILCLCGDIAVCGNDLDFEIFKSFIKKLSEMKFYHILHIAGNHEYYCSKRPGVIMKTKYNYQKINEKLAGLSSEFPKYRFLNNSHFDYNTGSRIIRFLGTTLWTRIPEVMHNKAKAMMNDYAQIIYDSGSSGKPDDIQKLTPGVVSTLNQQARNFISRSIAAMKRSKNITGVLLVHHKPDWDKSKDIKSMYDPAQVKATQISDYCYFNDLITLEAPIKCVMYGHTHKRDNRLVNGVRYVSNPRGYPGEHTGFNKKETVEI